MDDSLVVEEIDVPGGNLCLVEEFAGFVEGLSFFLREYRVDITKCLDVGLECGGFTRLA